MHATHNQVQQGIMLLLSQSDLVCLLIGVIIPSAQHFQKGDVLWPLYPALLSNLSLKPCTPCSKLPEAVPPPPPLSHHPFPPAQQD